MKRKGNAQAKKLTKIALFVALITVCAWIALPFPVPFTLQTFGLFLALFSLGGRSGSLAILAYLLLGGVGVPVFSGFTGGVSALLGSGGGYLFGFLLAALLYLALERTVCRGRKGKLLAAYLGQLVCYAVGTVWFALVYLSAGGEIGFWAAVLTCVAPYLLPDAVKILLALFVAERINRRGEYNCRRRSRLE